MTTNYLTIYIQQSNYPRSFSLRASHTTSVPLDTNPLVLVCYSKKFLSARYQTCSQQGDLYFLTSWLLRFRHSIVGPRPIVLVTYGALGFVISLVLYNKLLKYYINLCGFHYSINV